MSDLRGVFALGECMLELSGAPGSSVNTAYGGDTLNTAVYLSRLGISTTFLSALGDDASSDWLLQQWREEGIDTRWVRRIPGAKPGLYWIHLDDSGERTFTYWRGESAARQVFDDSDYATNLANLIPVDSFLYLSGITLSILSDPARETLWSLLQGLRKKGVRICFDGNFRPAGWGSLHSAQEAFNNTLEHIDIALPTFDDEAMVFADKTPEETVLRLQQMGVGEVVVKLGAEGCYVARGDVSAWVPTQPQPSVVDTTAAGDAFNAAYLAARIRGLDPIAAAHQGHTLAGRVIEHRGAIMPVQHMPLTDK
ncbi:sugar kinase [Luminiphilus sp.]|nr:sugar kinase [Luminiphilus sp.]MDB3923847.1 sugar kinase [Luminiphilus sp.]